MDNILIADSSPKNSELMSLCLVQKGYQVMTAANGHQIIAKTQLFGPDLIILDTHFDDMSGYEICKKIRGNPNSKHTLILFICSLETKDATIKAFESGADDIMEKTFDAVVLSAKVASLLRVSHLRAQLYENFAELEEKNKVLDFQLKMGQQIQRSIMKDYDVEAGGARLLSNYLPALDIGGDFYDVSIINEYSTGLCIGDVSGHGISAALLTTMLLSMVKVDPKLYFNPDLFLSSINNKFCNIFEGSDIGMYSCLFCLLIDNKQRKLYYSNAGQPLPFYYNAKKGDVCELDINGTPIGMIPGSVYECKSLNYNSGDILVFYTDGLPDALYKSAPEEFGNRMRELLTDFGEDSAAKTAGPDLTELRKSIIDTFYDLNATASKKYILDDTSLVLCRFE
ncbi:MAG: fused response regulator/phosphatase [Clostridiales bacterium]|jgi:sigma-B regulation protein RsbU (phosphoserine phosphatase)|nr:fused response regulator/phosphatase [Clostridiales bacterium]